MPIETVDSIKVGDTIRFKTKAVHDNVYWSGKVTAICGYDIARQIAGSNLDIYYQDVKRVDSSIAELENAEYIIVKAVQDENISKTIVIGIDWIDVSTFEHVDVVGHVDIRVYNITQAKARDIVNLIQAQYPDYIATIIEK